MMIKQLLSNYLSQLVLSQVLSILNSVTQSLNDITKHIAARDATQFPI